MEHKKCFKCGKTRRLSMFYKHSEMLDGHLGKCKDCTKKDVRENYYKRLSRYKEYDRKRYADNAERRSAALARNAVHRVENPGKTRARQLTDSAIRCGRLVRQPCVECGEKAEAHHPDYRRPLHVVWLCRTHHRRLHAKFGPQGVEEVQNLPKRGSRWD